MNKQLIFGLLLLVLISSVSATVTLVTPASSAQVTGATVVWNVTNSSGFTNMINCTVWAKSASTANSTYATNISFATNDSASAKYINGTFNSAILEDSNDYTIFAQCANQTTSVQNTTANTGLIIDNTVPQAPSSLTPATLTGITSTTTQTFSSTVTNKNTTGCTYTIYRGGSSSDTASSSGTGTYSASTCSFTKAFSTSADNGLYSWVITATDGTNTTASSSLDLNVQIAGSTGGLPPGNYQNSGGQIVQTTSTQTTYWVFGIIAALIVLYIIFKRK